MRIIPRLHTLLMSRGSVGIVLMPTYDCNLRSVYCYERHRLSRGQEWLEHTITPSVLDDIFMQVKDFKSRGFTGNPNFRYYFKAVEDHTNTITDEDVLNELIRIGKTPEEAILFDSAYSYVCRRFSSWLGKNSFPQLKPKYCCSESGIYVIDPFGNIYPCWDVVGKDGEEIGFVENGRFMYNFNIAKWHTRTSDRMPECSSCPFMMLCGGGCAKAGIKALMKANCDDFQKRFAFAAPILIQKAMNGDYAGKKENHDEDDVSKDKGESILSSSKVNSKYINDPSCLSLSVNEFLRELNPDERNILMTTNSEREAADILKAHTVM